jgi:hypothetical protein
MKRRMDKELIIALAVISLLITTSIVFFLLFTLDIQISHNNIGGIIGSYSGLSSLVWLILLCRNC